MKYFTNIFYVTCAWNVKQRERERMNGFRPQSPHDVKTWAKWFNKDFYLVVKSLIRPTRSTFLRGSWKCVFSAFSRNSNWFYLTMATTTTTTVTAAAASTTVITTTTTIHWTFYRHSYCQNEIPIMTVGWYFVWYKAKYMHSWGTIKNVCVCVILRMNAKDRRRRSRRYMNFFFARLYKLTKNCGFCNK